MEINIYEDGQVIIWKHVQTIVALLLYTMTRL